jgi:uncharacterized protein (TIGR02271 family)
MGITTNQLQDLTDGDVVTTGGDKIGGIGQIYVDDSTGEPSWVTAKTGLFGTSESFVPLEGANISGGNIQVGYDKDKVKGAPRIDADGKLSPEEEEQLYSYYGLGSGTSTTDANYTTSDSGADYATTGTADSGADYTAGTTSDSGADYATAGTTADRGADYETDRAVGHDTSGPTTDDAMTLSEERLNVGTQTQEAGRARLRKYVVTENVTQTVPVSREEVRLEREPITDANVGDATSGPDISEEEHEVVLHEEVPVVQKDAVPVERVRLNTETVTEEQTVSEEVRKEQIDTDTDTGTTRGR